MENNTRIIRFSNGSMIVCMVEEVDNSLEQSHINVTFPIEVISMGVEGASEDRAMEQYNLKAWMGLSDDTQFEIATKDITVMSTLSEEYMRGYENVVDRLYFRDEAAHSRLENDDEFSPEDLLEYLQIKEKGELN